MQVTETLSQGLKREYSIVLSADDLGFRLEQQLAELKEKVRLNGFRPGKVPVAHLKRVYGRSVMAEVMQQAINEANSQIISQHGLRLAREPKIDLPADQASIEAAIEARGDLAYTVALEVLPKFEVGTFDDLAVERLVSEVSDEDVAAAIDRLARESRAYSPKAEGAHAETGDRLTVDFDGAIGGEAFEGGSGKDVAVILGSNAFIPGVEEQLVGAVGGEKRTVRTTFPENYPNGKLAGKEATFDVSVKTLAAPSAVAIDDEFAKGLGLEGLEKLRERLRAGMADEYAQATRGKLKRRLLDALDGRYSFELPQGLVDQEFDSVWRQVEEELKASGRSFADENTTEEAARADYRRIAERRVRLGLLLAEVGDKADVKVSDEELTQALIARARAFPGREKQVWDLYRKNPQAMAELRAPIYEDKVIDHILGLAKITDRPVSREELLRPDEDEATPAARPASAAP